MYDFQSLPFFDNHTHLIQADEERHCLLSSVTVTPTQLAAEFLHGRRDDPASPLGISPELSGHLEHLGVVQTLVHLLSRRLGCPATLRDVAEARNRLTATDAPGYARALYEEAHILAEVVDSGLPMGDPLLSCFPCPVLRLFQMEPLVDRLLQACGTLAACRAAFEAGLRQAAAEGFAGVKCHVLERVSVAPRLVGDREAGAAYVAAASGDPEAWNVVYLALLTDAMLLCQELDLPLHIHTGCTGNPNDLRHGCCDPFTMAPYLSDPRFYDTTVVFLHGSFPQVQHAALLCHSFPRVWVDLGWTLPWTSLGFAQCLSSVLAVAPHSKVLLGSGQHGIPEISWMAAKVAKDALAEVLGDLVRRDLLGLEQGQDIAERVLYRNAQALYARRLEAKS